MRILTCRENSLRESSWVRSSKRTRHKKRRKRNKHSSTFTNRTSKIFQACLSSLNRIFTGQHLFTRNLMETNLKRSRKDSLRKCNNSPQLKSYSTANNSSKRRLTLKSLMPRPRIQDSAIMKQSSSKMTYIK